MSRVLRSWEDHLSKLRRKVYAAGATDNPRRNPLTEGTTCLQDDEIHSIQNSLSRVNPGTLHSIAGDSEYLTSRTCSAELGSHSSDTYSKDPSSRSGHGQLSAAHTGSVPMQAQRNNSRKPLLVVGDADASLSSPASAGYIFGSPEIRHSSSPRQLNTFDLSEPLSQFTRKAYILQADDESQNNDGGPWHLPKSAPVSVCNRCLPFLHDPGKSDPGNRVSPPKLLLGFTLAESRPVQATGSDSGNAMRVKGGLADAMLRGIGAAGRSLELNEAAQTHSHAEQQQQQGSDHQKHVTMLQLHPTSQSEMRAKARPLSDSTSGGRRSLQLPYIAEDMEEGSTHKADEH